MILEILAGALGALMASGLFALGFFIGRSGGTGTIQSFRRAAPAGESGARREAEEQQAAFEQILRYSSADAYRTREDEQRGGKGL